MNNFSKTECSGKRGKKKLAGKQDKGFTEEINEFIKSVKGEIRAQPISLTSLINTTKATIATRQAIQAKKAIQI